MPFRVKGGNEYVWLERPRKAVIFLFSCVSLAICELTDQLEKMVSKGQKELRFAMILRNAPEEPLLFRLKCREIVVRMGREQSYGEGQEEGPCVWPLPSTGPSQHSSH